MASLDDYLPAALANLGRITILVAPIDHFESVYDPASHVLRVDPGANVARAIADMLVILVDGQSERGLVGIAGGRGDPTACGVVAGPPSSGFRRADLRSVE